MRGFQTNNANFGNRLVDNSIFGDVRLFPSATTGSYGYIPVPTSNIVTTDLQLYLDAGNASSYPGSGTTWTDLSGNNRNFTLNGSPAYSTDSGGCIVLDGIDDYATGPASNAFGLNQEHTLEIVLKSTELRENGAFNWVDSGGNRTIMAHLPWSDNTLYYDVAGCCGTNQRLTWSTGGVLLNNIAYMTFRCRTGTSPYREIFQNNVQKANSTTATATLSFGTTAAIIGSFNTSAYRFKGNIYLFRLYSRGLTDAELLQNYNADKGRFGLT